MFKIDFLFILLIVLLIISAFILMAQPLPTTKVGGAGKTLASVAPASDKLFDLVVKRGSYEDYYRLSTLIAKFVRKYVKDYPSFIAGLFRGPLSDADILARVGKLLPTPRQDNQTDDANYRDKLHSQEIYDVLYGVDLITKLSSVHPNKREFLDYGCGDCKTASVLSKMLNMKPYGADIKQWVTGFKRTSEVEFKEIDTKTSKVDYPDAKFDLVTANMVLHHIPDVEIALAEIKRVLKPEGYLELREHDLAGPVDYAITDIEHMLYDISMNKQSLSEFRKSYYSKFHSAAEWDDILKKAGFKKITGPIIPKYTPTRYYYAVYQLVS